MSNCLGLPHWPKRSAKLGANFFQLCFLKKINWANQQELEKKKKTIESQTKWRVSLAE